MFSGSNPVFITLHNCVNMVHIVFLNIYVQWLALVTVTHDSTFVKIITRLNVIVSSSLHGTETLTP